MRYLLWSAVIGLFVVGSAFAQRTDASLRSAMEQDKQSRSADGKLTTLTASEHLARGRAYFDNRLFPQSREHFQKIFDNYSSDPAMSGALFMTGRSYYWERDYVRAIP